MHIHTLHTNCFDQFIDFRQIQSSKHRCHPSRSFSDRHFRARRSSPLVPWDWSVIHGFNMCNGLKWNVYLRPPNIRYIYNIYCSIYYWIIIQMGFLQNLQKYKPILRPFQTAVKIRTLFHEIRGNQHVLRTSPGNP